jgi:hypothetical protein
MNRGAAPRRRRTQRKTVQIKEKKQLNPHDFDSPVALLKLSDWEGRYNFGDRGVLRCSLPGK